MDIQNILDEIKANLTGDLQKDGPYLKEQADKYKNTEISDELERQMAEILFELSQKNFQETLNNFLDQKNSDVYQRIENAEKRFENLNFNGGIKILEEIIRDNVLAWNDTDDCTYKCFGTPLEYLLYINLFEDKNNAKTIKPVTFNLAKVYWLYAYALLKKNRTDDALRAIERAVSLNPVDPEVYIQYAEIAKALRNPEILRNSADMLLKCAVTKKQVGKAYFNFCYYYSEIEEYEKALALLQMSRIFGETEFYESELEFISQKMGISGTLKMYSTEELMNILISENIQPGPSAAIAHLSNILAQEFEAKLEPENAIYFYNIVHELTESNDALEHIQKLERTIKK